MLVVSWVDPSTPTSKATATGLPEVSNGAALETALTAATATRMESMITSGFAVDDTSSCM
jgi:hypothetical protein